MDASTTISSGVPAGAVFDFAGAVAPHGYLICDGSLKSRVDYARLFEAIGDVYGAGDGSTTFKLPDLRGRTSIGVGEGPSLTNRELGDLDGKEFHTLNEAEMPSHTHVQNAHDHTSPPHEHSIIRETTGAPVSSAVYLQHNVAPVARGGSTLNSNNTLSGTAYINSTIATNQNTGGGNPHNNMQPFLVLNKIIKY